MWHVVSLKWYRDWKRYVGVEDEPACQLPASPPTASSSAPVEGMREASERAVDAGKEKMTDTNKEAQKDEIAGEKKPAEGKDKEEAGEKMQIGEASSTKSAESEYPGPIFNDELVLFEDIMEDPDESKQYAQYPLRPGLRECVDYTLLPDPAWIALHKAYGGLDLRRLGYPTVQDKVAVDVYLQRVAFLYIARSLPVPKDKRVVYISRHESAKELAEKCKRIFTSMANTDTEDRKSGTKVHLWKLLESDPAQLFHAIEKARNVGRFPVAIDGTMVDDVKTVEELAIGDSTLILVELCSRKEESMFQERKVICPRLNNDDSIVREEDLKKYVTVENRAFMRIPFKAILDPARNCGRTGLENLGNTCYMNSGLQCLSSCQELTKYFLLGLYKGEVNKENPLGQKGYLASSYAELLSEMWMGHSHVVNAYHLKKRIVQKAEQFSGYSQQDSQELILYVLDGLHEDLNRVKKKPYIASKDYNGTPDRELCIQMWEDHMKRNQSVIVDLFCGQLKSRVVCPQCTKDSVTFDPFMVLSVPIPQLSHLVVTFVFSDFTEGAAKLKVQVTEGSLLQDTEEKLREQLKLPPESRVMYATVKKGKIERRFAPDATCGEVLRNGGDLFAYEYMIPPVAAGKPVQLVELQCQYNSGGILNRRQELGYPLMLAVPEDTTIRELKCLVLQRFQPFIKEVAVGKNVDRLKAMYEHYFAGRGQTEPYVLEIVNNRPSTTRYLFSTKYADCEFCTGGGHAGNCKLEYKDEERLPFGILLSRTKVKRDFILNMVIKESQTAMDVEKIRRHEEDVRMIRPAADKNVKISLYDCLENFSNEELLDSHNMWYCPKCKESVQAKKKMDIYRLPTIIAIHLKRFKHKTSMWSSHKKIDDFVSYPISGLDLRRYLKSTADISGGSVYDLFAVSNHYGGLTGGHYTATCFNSFVGKWLYFNDSSVSVADEEDIVSSAGYVLFYRRVESLQPPSQKK